MECSIQRGDSRVYTSSRHFEFFLKSSASVLALNRIYLTWRHSAECNSILLLHSCEIELSIRHHVTKINQLNYLNLTRYYVINNDWMRFIVI